MQRRRAATAAVASSVWSAALSLAAIPIYVSRMGIEAYGLIGFFITSQAVLQILDLGLASAVNREVARGTALGDLAPLRTLLATLARVYWLVAVAIAAVFAAAAPAIAATWLNASRLASEDIVQSLTLMGLLIGLRWPISVYQNTLIGAQRLVSASLLTAAMSTLSVAASIAAVTSLSPRPQSVFAAQAAATIVHLALASAFAWRALGGPQGAMVDFRYIRRLWRFSAGMSGVILTGIALTQLDKVLLSKLLPLDAFGEYMLAASVVGGLSVLVAPLFSIIYPEFSALIAHRRRDRLVAQYHRDTRLFAIVFLPIVMALGLYAHDLVWLWIGRPDTAAAVASTVALLCIGSAINGIMFFPYSLQLAHGLSWIPFAINLALLSIAAPLIVVLATSYGGPGGATAWAIVEVLYLVVGTFITHRYIDAGSASSWACKSLAAPLVITTVMALSMHPVIVLTPAGSLARVVAVACSAAISSAMCALCLPDVRSRLMLRIRSRTASRTAA
jgi:O-antigen/teichoic acid export membrane protein